LPHALAIVAALVLSACYTYVPLATPSPAPGSYLALTLTDSGSEALTRYLGPNVRVVRGRYLATGDRGLLVSVSSLATQRGDELSWAGETVTLPTGAIASIEVRRLAKGSSALLAGASVAGVVATVGAVNLIGGGSSSGSGSPPTKK